MSKTKRSTDRYLELHAQGLTNSEIARRCGVWPSAVTRYFYDNGISRNGISPHSKHEKALRRAANRKLTYKQAAKELGLTPRYVSTICKRLGIKLVDGRGAGNNRGKGSARVLPKVKPLEWSKWGVEYDANSPFGTFTVKMDGHSGYYAYLSDEKITNDLHDMFDRSTPDDCMEQCFKYVQARILSALDL